MKHDPNNKFRRKKTGPDGKRSPIMSKTDNAILNPSQVDVKDAEDKSVVPIAMETGEQLQQDQAGQTSYDKLVAKETGEKLSVSPPKEVDDKLEILADRTGPKPESDAERRYFYIKHTKSSMVMDVFYRHSKPGTFSQLNMFLYADLYICKLLY